MAAKKPLKEKSTTKPARKVPRRVEEIYFFEYIKDKKDHKHIEEIGLQDYLSRKKVSDAV
jgi:predicted NAD/FAD-binding protein